MKPVVGQNRYTRADPLRDRSLGDVSIIEADPAVPRAERADENIDKLALPVASNSRYPNDFAAAYGQLIDLKAPWAAPDPYTRHRQERWPARRSALGSRWLRRSLWLVGGASDNARLRHGGGTQHHGYERVLRNVGASPRPDRAALAQYGYLVRDRKHLVQLV